MSKPQVPKKIPISEIKEKKLLELKKGLASSTDDDDDDDDYNYQMPRDTPSTYKKKNRTLSEIKPAVEAEDKLKVNEEEIKTNKIGYENDMIDNEEYFSNNYSNLSDMASKMAVNEDKKEYYYNKLVQPKLPPKSVINSINKQENLRKKSNNNEDIYEYTYCQVFAGDERKEGELASKNNGRKFVSKKSINEENEEENDYYKRSKILSINKMNNYSSTLLGLEELIDKNFINKQDSENYLRDYSQFENQVYSNTSNLKCADCRVLKPNWISCRFMITLCNQCAYIHNKFGHELNEYYLIEIKELFGGKANDLTKICILKLLFEIGNEKFNLLLEQNSQKEIKDSDLDDDSNYNRECMIQEKYLNSKPFLDDYDLNLQLFTNIQGNCVSLTSYNIYLLDTLNTTMVNYKLQNSLLDQAVISKQNLQIAYLFINNFKTCSYIFNSFDCLLNTYKQLFIGELSGSYDRKKTSPPVISQLDSNCLNFMKSGFNIKLDSIRVINRINENEIEIQHFSDHTEQQLKSLYLTFNYQNELFLWQKELVKKLICSYLNFDLNLINLTQKLIKLNKIFDLINSNNNDIKYFGFLSIVKSTNINQQQQQQQIMHQDNFDDEINSDDDSDEDNEDDNNQLMLYSNSKVFSFICLSKYDELIFKRDLVIINLISLRYLKVVHIDLRKMLRLKRNLETFLLTLDMPMNKSFTFKFDSLTHLNEWFSELNRVSDFDEFKSLEMQYLNKSNIPLIIEQSLNFMQINNSIIPSKNFNGGNIDAKNHKFIENLILNLENNKFFNLFNITIEPNIVIDKSMVGYLIIQQFLKETFLFPKFLFESIIKNLNNNSKLSEIFTEFCFNAYNIVFYSTFKFILMNLYIFLSLKRSELDDTEYLRVKKNLVNVYSKLIFHLQTLNYDSEELNKLLNYLIENFIEIFQINKNYLKKQFKIIEKSIQIHKSVNMKMANLNYTTVSANEDGNESSNINSMSNNFLITVFVLHSNNEQVSNFDKHFKQ
jgi:hypothetical protein